MIGAFAADLEDDWGWFLADLGWQIAVALWAA